MPARCARSAWAANEQRDGHAVVNTWWLFWGLVFGSFGMGYFLFGKRQERVVPMLCGLALMAFPYFVSSTLVLVLVGLALIALPWFYRD